MISQSSVTSTSSTDNDSLSSSTQPRSIATVTVNRGTTVVITSFIPSDPTITLSTAIPGATTKSTPGTGMGSVNQPDSSQTTPLPVDQSTSFWDSTGKVAGVFVAVGVVIAILAMALIWMCRTKRRRSDEEKSESVSATQPTAGQMAGTQPVSRSASSLLLLGRTYDRSHQDEIVSPTSVGSLRSPTDLVVPVVDQRLDPQSMMIRFDDNDSRTSFRDEEDYSRRVWRVTNVSDSDSLRSS